MREGSYFDSRLAKPSVPRLAAPQHPGNPFPSHSWSMEHGKVVSKSGTGRLYLRYFRYGLQDTTTDEIK